QASHRAGARPRHAREARRCGACRSRAERGRKVRAPERRHPPALRPRRQPVSHPPSLSAPIPHLRQESSIRMRRLLLALLLAVLALPASADVATRAYPLPRGGGSPHDVAVTADGVVWYTAQRDGKLGRLDPTTGKIDLVPLGDGAAPHGVIIGPDGAP